MRILVLGSGAREHALAWKLSTEPAVTSIVCAPGNPGIARSIPTAALDPLDTDAVVHFVDDHQIDLVVVGPEAPLERGIVDRFVAQNRRIFGPTRAAAQLETSKAFAKDFMARHGVPTARFQVCAGTDEALAVVAEGTLSDIMRSSV